MNQRLHGVRGYLFRKLLPWAQRFVPLREDALADIGYGWPLLRQMLLEIGRRFAAAGVIEEAEQIFWLEENEVETVGSTLEAGDSAESLTASIRIRQAEWKAAKQVTPPPALPVHTRWMGVRADKVLPARVTVGEARQLSGVAGSPGRVTAPPGYSTVRRISPLCSPAISWSPQSPRRPGRHSLRWPRPW